MDEKANDLYQSLCDLANIAPCQNTINLKQYINYGSMANTTRSERIAVGLHVVLDCFKKYPKAREHFDLCTLDGFIAAFDKHLGKQVDVILHHPDFQALESLWQSLYFLLAEGSNANNTRVDIFDVSQSELEDDFLHADDLENSTLYKNVYVAEYDTPGGEPYAAMVSDYRFTVEKHDIALLRQIAQVASSSHCPFIGHVDERFFLKNNLEDVEKIPDLQQHFLRAEYIAWHSLRKMEEARYLALTFPKFLLRTPYDNQRRHELFVYQESVESDHANPYLWGSASFALARNLNRSFINHGWCAHICGLESGGKVENLPIHYFEEDLGQAAKMPTQMLLSETKELMLANLGIIPLLIIKIRTLLVFSRPIPFIDPSNL